jgi:type IV pilus assembly protein PilX
MVNCIRHRPLARRSRRQQGIVLITGLIFLVVLTVIVLALMRSATLEERMAANARNRQLALQGAEAVLRDARDTLFPVSGVPGSPIDPFDPGGFTSGCTNGLCSPPAGGTPRWQSINFDDTSVTRGFAVPADSNLSGVASQPRYFVEVLSAEGGQPSKICPKVLYRVTARGVGRDSKANVFVEMIVRFRPATYADGSCG